MKRFVIEEIKKALQKLRMVIVGTMKWMVSLIIHLLIVFFPIVIIVFIACHSLSGLLKPDSGMTTNSNPPAVRTLGGLGLSPSNLIQSLIREVRFWAGEIRKFRP